jgi:hypothetical protein
VAEGRERVGGLGMKVTTRARIHSTTPEPWLELAIPRDYLESVRKATAKGWAAVDIQAPRRPRTTGEKSQNNLTWKWLRAIALETGNELDQVEAACKLQALGEGYPVESVLGQWVAKGQSDLTVEECSRWIVTIQRIAAELGITIPPEED